MLSLELRGAFYLYLQVRFHQSDDLRQSLRHLRCAAEFREAESLSVAITLDLFLACQRR